MTPAFLAPIVAVTSLSGFVIAAETVPSDPVGWLQTGGTAGLIVGLTYAVMAFTRGWVVSGKSHQADLELRDKRIAALELENREQSLFLRDEVVPLVTRLQDVAVKILENQAFDERLQRERPR